MNLACSDDFERVKEIFYQHKEWFPHVRTDYMMRMIEDKQLILDNDVIITFHHTKSKQTVGNVIVPKYSTILHQIANGTQGKGNAREVLNRFHVTPGHLPTSKRSKCSAPITLRCCFFQCIPKT